MFESDDWTFEDNFDDIDEKASHPTCQNEEESSSVKRRKLDTCNFASALAKNTCGSRPQLDAAANAENKNSPASSNKNISPRGKLLLEIFQRNAPNREITKSLIEPQKPPSNLPKQASHVQPSKTTTKSTASHHKESKRKNIKSSSKEDLGNKVKLVRMFPGPAGLIPDPKKSNHPEASCLHSAIELESESSKRIETNVPKSQDEKNLFDEKAWKLLLDDLPHDFFNEYGILNMKSKANASHCDSMKVGFVAGMIEYIDHSHDDPLIVLKDYTGSIEGTVHRDIALNYPGVLEPNVVVLLRDVGLLKTVTYVVTNKYHILISRANLVAVYSAKGRIASTSRIEDILSSISSSSQLDRDQCTPMSGCCTASELQQRSESCDNTLLQAAKSTNISISDRRSTLESKYSKRTAEGNTGPCRIATESIFEDLDHLMSIDDLNVNDFFAEDCEFTSSAEQNCPDRSSSKTAPQTGKVERCESQGMKNPKESMIHSEDKNKTRNLSQALREHVANVAVVDRPLRSYENRPSLQDNHTQGAQSDSKWKQSKWSTMKDNAEDTGNSLNHFAGDNKYDSDDEFLSQVDIDNI